ncbi:glycosyltransferase [Thiobacillus denitrificans]|uniref:glycosyltransferase n=1 Tax=Thiobacillus denitrificans TaxID=36861 RepID=UPI0003789858|nr:glycosyltransferase [Thiobacillus denitrificans]
MKPQYRSLQPARQAVVLLFLAIGAWYLNWRLETFNAAHPVFSWLLYGAEVFGFFTAVLNIFMTWRLSERTAPSPVLGLKVDVFIPTYNEDVEMVRRTALAARAMKYPHETWILDDGNREAMREMAQSLGVRYLARTDNAHAKAGNLNHALPHSTADLIATFDADHAPRQDFLLKTLGYFSDPSVAFVQTPQDFYNLDSFQNRTDPGSRVAWSEQSLFFRVIQRGKDYWNAAFYCGSCAVIRRQSLDSIGGFATGTVTEDLHTSLLLHKKGYRSVYHDESLAYGVAPAKIEPFLKQRVRWGVGAMNVWRKEGILFSRGLTLPQRLNYLATVLAYFDGWQKMFFYFAPVYVLMAGAMPIAVDGWVFLLHFVPYYLVNFLAFEEISRGYGRSLMIEQYNMARFASFAWSTLGVFKMRKRFGVTAKKQGEHALSLGFLLPQLAVMGLNTLAIPVGIALFYFYGHLPKDGMWANVVWATVNTWLAVLVVRFTAARGVNRRNEYRFALPLAARLDGVLGTVDDLSPSGMSFYGVLRQAKVGDRVAVTLYLPDGELDAELEIRTLMHAGKGEQAYVRAIGGTFHAMPLSVTQRIEQFLYGSDAQWRINRYRDDSPTPLQRMGLVDAPQAPSEPIGYWVSCEVSANVARADRCLVGLVSAHAGEKGEPRLLVNRPLDPGCRHVIQAHGRTGLRTLHAKTAAHETILTGLGMLHLYRLELSAGAVASVLHSGVEPMVPAAIAAGSRA